MGANTSKQENTITVKSKVIEGDIGGNRVFNSVDFSMMRQVILGVKPGF